MTNSANTKSLEPSCFILPEVAYTQSGFAFDPSEDSWTLTDGSTKINLNFHSLSATVEFVHALKWILVWYAENRSLFHLRNLFYHMKNLLDFIAVDQGIVPGIDAADILNYRAALPIKDEWYIGALSSLLRRWHDLGAAGVSAEVPLLLSQLTFNGNEKGTATATMDPINGPYTDIELEGLQIALNDAYRESKVELFEYVLGWLFIGLGYRPKQYAALKVCDVKREPLKDGSFQYVLCIPRAKQRGVAVRGEFKSRVLSAELGLLTYDYARIVEKEFSGKLTDPLQAPLFPSSNSEGISGLEFHPLAKELGSWLKNTFSRLAITSERTGEVIHVSARRFRQTIGTRAAEEGFGPLVIAELLDHSDTQNVQVYVGSTTAMAKRIDKAMAMHLAPLAQAFAGKLIDDGTQASRPFDPLNVIRAPEITRSFEAMSSCGKNGKCSFAKPIACYTCSSFEPWLDGPHEEVLEHLLEERERLMPVDARIASINDRTILAVAAVVQLCQIALKERKAVA